MTTDREPRFALGKLVATPGALAALQDSGQSAMEFLVRHMRGDWGDVCDEDAQCNERALEQGERIVSSYHTALEENLWIITEWDRSVTTILRPEEY